MVPSNALVNVLKTTFGTETSFGTETCWENRSDLLSCSSAKHPFLKHVNMLHHVKGRHPAAHKQSKQMQQAHLSTPTLILGHSDSEIHFLL